MDELSVGGSLNVLGGSLYDCKEVDAGGSITVGRHARVHTLDAGGSITVSGRLRGRAKLDAGGSIRIGGTAAFHSADAGGSLTVAGQRVASSDLSSVEDSSAWSASDD